MAASMKMQLDIVVVSAIEALPSVPPSFPSNQQNPSQGVPNAEVGSAAVGICPGRGEALTGSGCCKPSAMFGSGSFTSIFLMIRAGLPATTWKSGTSFVTTLPAPIVQPRPMVMPGNTIAFPPNQQSAPIVIGPPNSGPLIPFRRNGSRGWVPE